jgi:hypothetical protein
VRERKERGEENKKERESGGKRERGGGERKKGVGERGKERTKMRECVRIELDIETCVKP